LNGKIGEKYIFEKGCLVKKTIVFFFCIAAAFSSGADALDAAVTYPDGPPEFVNAYSGGGGGSTVYYTVTVKHEDESGAALKAPRAESVRAGGSFSAEAEAFAGYHYAETSVNGEKSTNPNVSVGAVNQNCEIIFVYGRDRPALSRKAHNWYIRGYPDNTLQPEGSLTRAETAMLFYRLIENEGKEDAPPRAVFSDAEPAAWYDKGLTLLHGYGVVAGYPDGTYRPEKPVTRAEIAKIACMFDEADEDAENPFPDVPENHWAAPYIASAAQKGWVQGDEDGRFRPDSDVTRAEMATLIDNALNRHIKKEDIPDGVHRWNDLEPAYWAYADLMEAAHTHSYERVAAAAAQSVVAPGQYEIWIDVAGTGLDDSYNE
jgi:hypothetical protein